MRGDVRLVPRAASAYGSEHCLYRRTRTVPPTAVLHRYFLRVLAVGKGMVPDTKKEVPFWVRNYEEAQLSPEAPIKVGSE